MYTTRLGRSCARSSQATKRILQYAAGLVVFIIIAVFILKKSSYSIPLDVDFIPLWVTDKKVQKVPPLRSQLKVGPCSVRKNCPAGTFSFQISSGAANVVAPKICIENKLVLGSGKNNADPGLNTVVLNGKTGKVALVQSFNLLKGEVRTLVEFLQGLENGNIVLMATYDEPSTKLNDEARNAIQKLGSSSIKSVDYRDNWVIVGGKGAGMNSTFEKIIKNSQRPGILVMEGCIPRYH